MSNWNARRLDSLVDIRYGKSIVGGLSEEGDVTVVGTGGSDRRGHQWLSDGATVVVARKGSLGNPRLIIGKCWPIDTTFYLANLRGVTPEWLHRVLAMVDLEALNEATGVPSISRDRLGEVEIPVPPLHVQNQITDSIKVAEKLIEQAEAGIAKRRRLRVGLVQDLLTRGLNEDGRCRDEATHPFQDTPIGRLPAQWDLKRLAEIAGFITKGSTPTTHGFDWVDEGVLFLRSESVQTSGFTLSGSMFISEAAHAAMTRSVILGGDLLMSITGYIGHVCRYPVGMPEANINQHIARIRVDEAQADSAFVLHALADWRVQRRLELEVTGLAYPQIGLKQVREILLPIPPPDEQRRIVAVLGGADAEIVAEEAVLTKLRRVKAGLMRDLLTGDVPVQALLDQAALA